MLLALTLGLLCLSGCAAKQAEEVPEIVFRYAENQTGDYPTTLAAYHFADRVLELSGGRMRVFVYPNASLGDENSVVEQLQVGGIDFSRVSLSLLSEYDSSLTVLQLPYLYEDSDHMWRVLDGEIGAEYLLGLTDIQLIGMAWVDGGVRNFYTSTGPVRTLADMQGLRIRVQENAMMQRLVELLGAVPTQMRYSDVLPALQTGRIDGAENSYPSYESTGHYLVARYVLEDGHTRIPEVMLASQAAMDKLSEADREIIEVAAAEAAEYQRKLWQEYELRTKEQVLAIGCEIYEMTAEEKQAFVDSTAQMAEEFAAEDGEVIAAIAALRD